MTTRESSPREPLPTWTAPKVRRLAATEAEAGVAGSVDGFETFS